MYLVHKSYYSYEADRLIRRPQVLGMFNIRRPQPHAGGVRRRNTVSQTETETETEK